MIEEYPHRLTDVKYFLRAPLDNEQPFWWIAAMILDRILIVGTARTISEQLAVVRARIFGGATADYGLSISGTPSRPRREDYVESPPPTSVDARLAGFAS